MQAIQCKTRRLSLKMIWLQKWRRIVLWIAYGTNIQRYTERHKEELCVWVCASLWQISSAIKAINFTNAWKSNRHKMSEWDAIKLTRPPHLAISTFNLSHSVNICLRPESDLSPIRFFSIKNNIQNFVPINEKHFNTQTKFRKFLVYRSSIKMDQKIWIQSMSCVKVKIIFCTLASIFWFLYLLHTHTLHIVLYYLRWIECTTHGYSYSYICMCVLCEHWTNQCQW